MLISGSSVGHAFLGLLSLASGFIKFLAAAACGFIVPVSVIYQLCPFRALL